jgi:hypothetical protein
VKKVSEDTTKFKLRTTRYLYTIVVKEKFIRLVTDSLSSLPEQSVGQLAVRDLTGISASAARLRVPAILSAPKGHFRYEMTSDSKIGTF